MPDREVVTLWKKVHHKYNTGEKQCQILNKR